ncbi:MAG: hypothetical protein ACI8RD_004803, partial [Bacillariaceae sp.]|jgi:hypothetical protein
VWLLLALFYIYVEDLIIIYILSIEVLITIFKDLTNTSLAIVELKIALDMTGKVGNIAGIHEFKNR